MLFWSFSDQKLIPYRYSSCYALVVVDVVVAVVGAMLYKQAEDPQFQIK